MTIDLGLGQHPDSITLRNEMSIPTISRTKKIPKKYKKRIEFCGVAENRTPSLVLAKNA